MSAFDVQGSYTQIHGAAYAGMIADTRFKNVRSMTFESANPDDTIAFGKALTFSSTDNNAVLGGTVFAGIVVGQQTNETEDAFAVGQTLGCMDEGSIWVEVIDAVVPGDVVQFDPATGDIGKGAGTLINDAIFETAAAPGELARVLLK